jgi:DNA-binding protein HU-beta
MTIWGGSSLRKADLVDAVAKKSGLTRKVAGQVVEAFMETVMEGLSKGEKVNLVGFGVFHVKTREARVGRNLQTGEEIQIPARTVPAFKAGKSLREAVR